MHAIKLQSKINKYPSSENDIPFLNLRNLNFGCKLRIISSNTMSVKDSLKDTANNSNSLQLRSIDITERSFISCPSITKYFNLINLVAMKLIPSSVIL
jgi:hypothetical protein